MKIRGFDGPAELRARLDALRAAYGPAHLESDPIGIVRGFRPAADREVAGVVAAALALGNVRAIRAKVRDALARTENAPADFARRAARDPRAAARAFRGFRHRFFVGRDVAALLARTGRLLDSHGSLGAAFAAFDLGEPDAAPALARLAEALTGGPSPLFPSPSRGSASKRSFLFLRWMVRRDDIDLGLWPVAPSRLLLPLDVHVARIARLLGLLRRRSTDLSAAREATAALARLDPADPVKYDFALARIGIVGGCRGRAAAACAACAVAGLCAATARPAARAA